MYMFTYISINIYIIQKYILKYTYIHIDICTYMFLCLRETLLLLCLRELDLFHNLKNAGYLAFLLWFLEL